MYYEKKLNKIIQPKHCLSNLLLCVPSPYCPFHHKITIKLLFLSVEFNTTMLTNMPPTMITDDASSPDDSSLLLLQQQQQFLRRHHQQMMMMRNNRRRRLSSGSMSNNTYPRQPIRMPVPPTRLVRSVSVEDASMDVTNAAIVPTIVVHTKAVSSSMKDQVLDGKSNRIENTDDAIVVGMDATATTIKSATASSSSSSSSYDDDNEAIDNDLKLLLALHKRKRMLFYRHAQEKLRQENKTLNKIGTRKIKHEIQCVQKVLHQINKLILLNNNNKTSTNDNDKIKIPDNSLSSSDNVLDMIQSQASLSSTKMMNQSVPDTIQSHGNDQDNDRVLVASVTNKKQKMIITKESMDAKLKQQQQQLLILLLKERTCRMKYVMMLFRNMNTYQRQLYCEMQSCIDNELMSNK